MKLTLAIAPAIAILALAGCDGADQKEADGADQKEADGAASAEAQRVDAEQAALDSMNYRPDARDDFEAPEYMRLQVSLDSMGYSPGVIDGTMSMATKNAIRAFQEADNKLDETGEYDAATKQVLSNRLDSSATRIITVPESWADAKYEKIPDDPAKKADLETLGYESLWERLAERFHTTPEVLYGLNPTLCAKSEAAEKSASDSTSGTNGPEDKPLNTRQGDKLASGPDTSTSSEAVSTSADARKQYQNLTECAHKGSLADAKIRVPNIVDRPVEEGDENDKDWYETLVSLGVSKEQAEAAKIVVDKSDHMLRVFDKNGKLLRAYTVTTGSSHDPLPLGEWKINGVSYNPKFSYDPDLFWDVPDSQQEQMLPPGPNGPVGVAWIDLSKEHYGIHGTSAPETIGTAQSHGCVRLTNWDVAELSQMVDSQTKVIFQA